MFGLYSEAGWLGSFPPVAPCGNLWRPVAVVTPCIASQQSPRVAVKPFTHFTIKYQWIRKLLEAAVNPLLMVRNLQDVAVKPYAYFCQEIFMVLEASGGCCESIIDGLESRGSCYETIYVLLQWNFHNLGSFRKLLRIHYWWFGISRRLLWSRLRTFTMKY